MHSKLASFAVVGLLACVLSACANTPTNTASAQPAAAPAKAAEPAKPTLSAEAQQALTAAESDWKNAKAKYALWTTTDSAYQNAQESAKAGDSATVLKLSKRVSDEAKVALGQLNYPSTEIK
ncbi:MAG: hypothetical protein KGZ83_08120 [Sulfuricella sp.]|nr:hypothetical protein [Sulfuricella sp.]